MIRRGVKRRGPSPRRVLLYLEPLEGRLVMSVDAASAWLSTAAASGMVEVKSGLFARPVAFDSVPSGDLTVRASVTPISPAVGPAVGGPYTPAQIRKAYGIDQLPYDGAGQTIAIVDAYDNPTVESDLAAFSARFNLPAANLVKAIPSGSTFVTTTQGGGTTPAYDAAWALEIALDVQWAHAIAPNARILLVEAATNRASDLFNAVEYAVEQGASQVSMSWGGIEFAGVGGLDPYFADTSVSFFAAAGDNGAEVMFPAVSPYVVGVGGTTIALDSAGNKLAETTWGGSGGATSVYVARPSYQTGFQASTFRGVPDVAYNADPGSGVYVINNGSYLAVGGTSAGAPQWAALTALVNQGRVAGGLPTIGSGLRHGLNTALYDLAGSTSYTNFNGDFTDITTGSNGIAATIGYDNATGLGSPVANKLVPRLVAYGTTFTTNLTPNDAGFEAVAVGSNNFAAFAYSPNGSAWTFTGGSGLSGNNSGFTQGIPNAPEGQQVAFLQGHGVISQAVTGWAAGTYTLSLTAAQRLGNDQSFQVFIDDAVVANFNPVGSSYQSLTTASFAVAAGTHTIRFVGTGPAGVDNTAFLDNVTITKEVVIAAPTPGDASFEDVAVGGFAYNPGGSAWTFSGSAGLTANDSGFTSGNSATPRGRQVAFLQNQGVISQAVANWAAGSYRIGLLAAQRGNIRSNQVIQVLVDGAVVGTIRPSGTNYEAYATATFTVAAGSHTISFVGSGAVGGDNTAFLDAITITRDVTPTPPTPGDSGFEAVAVGSNTFAAFAYNPAGSAWTFTGSAGLSGDNSGFTQGIPNAPEGRQVAFLQQQGSLTQAVTGWAAGTYTLSLTAAQRLGNDQSFQVFIDDAVVANFNPVGSSYQSLTTASFAVAAGTHTIHFVGTGPAGVDNTAFLDNVTISLA